MRNFQPNLGLVGRLYLHVYDCKKSIFIKYLIIFEINYYYSHNILKLYCKLTNSSKLILKIPKHIKGKKKKKNKNSNEVNLYICWVELG